MRSLTHLAFLAAAAFLLAGCSSASSDLPSTTQVVITTQPQTQTVPIDRTATFNVAATGAAPLRYQWTRDGEAIAGATGASYTTPAVALTDTGSTFQVTVSNASSTAQSNTVTLTAGARAPAFGDVRYLLWEQVPSQWDAAGNAGNLGATEETATNALGTPLQMGSTWISTSGCDWPFSFLYLPPSPTSFNMSYQQDFTQTESYASFLLEREASNIVITSMDLEPACNAFGVSMVQTLPPGGFDQRLEDVPPAQIQSAATQDGAESRIITAVTFDPSSGDALLLSYGWQSDTTTAYEAQTVVATPANVAAQAAALAGQGYFISAFGGNDTQGYILVGMRVRGDTLPRPFTNGSATPTSAEDVPYTVVVHLAEPSGQTWMYEQ